MEWSRGEEQSQCDMTKAQYIELWQYSISAPFLSNSVLTSPRFTRLLFSRAVSHPQLATPSSSTLSNALTFRRSVPKLHCAHRNGNPCLKHCSFFFAIRTWYYSRVIISSSYLFRWANFNFLTRWQHQLASVHEPPHVRSLLPFTKVPSSNLL